MVLWLDPRFSIASSTGSAGILIPLTQVCQVKLFPSLWTWGFLLLLWQKEPGGPTPERRLVFALKLTPRLQKCPCFFLTQASKISIRCRGQLVCPHLEQLPDACAEPWGSIAAAFPYTQKKTVPLRYIPTRSAL